MSEHASRESVERSLDRIATVDLDTNAVCTLHPDACSDIPAPPDLVYSQKTLSTTARACRVIFR